MAFIKVQKARKFNYTPRHYDPELEAFRQKRAERSIDFRAPNADGEGVRAGFSRIRERRNIQKVNIASGRPIRLFVTMSVLLILFFFILKYTNLLTLFYN